MKDYQSILFPYAYNILGSAEDAKDAIQDVVLKYTSKDIQPENEKNYLIKGVINQAINIKRQKQKRQPGDTWLPEPISTETSDLGVELRELVSYSLLFLLERLNPKERAVFILREAFAYTHEEIAEALSITIENSRKLLSRANKKVQQKEKPGTNDKILKDHFRCLDQFVAAIRNKDMKALYQLFSEDITFHADGGKNIQVFRKYSSGIEEVATLMVYVHHTYQKNQTIRPAYVNHQPALLYYYCEKLVVCQVFEFAKYPSKINRISSVLDPLKLKNLQISK
jgi:RNA polymerase sigma-70 factor (ECF subfamily)